MTINMIRIVSLLAAVASLVIGTFSIESANPSIFAVALCSVVCITAGAVIASTFFMTERSK